jgi:hypothetical protein
VSASAGSELAMLAGSENGIVGKLRAAMGLLGLWQLGHAFGHQLREQQADVALCTFQSIWDLAAIPALRGQSRSSSSCMTPSFIPATITHFASVCSAGLLRRFFCSGIFKCRNVFLLLLSGLYF